MKLKHLITTTIAALALAVPAFAGEETPLEKEMDILNKAVKFVKRNLADATQKDASVAKVTAAIKACEAAAKLEPKMAKGVPAAEKEKFLADYRAGVEAMGKQFAELKAAVEAGKADEVTAILDKLAAGKKEGHKKFTLEE